MSKQLGPDDGVLITLYRNGNEAAFNLLVDRYQSKVFTTIFLIVKDQDVAEDLLQDVFVKVLYTLNSGKYKEEGKFQPWVMRIAHNMAIDHFRKAKRYPTILLEDGSNLLNSLSFVEDSSEEQRIKDETFAWVRNLIDELPEAQKEVVIMRHYLDMSFQEIAEQTGVSINTALGRMRYALNHIRKKMKQVNSAYDKIIYPK
ncbi:MAG: RNA polymerase sigma factor [Bacteroidetes bacterium]|nr:RNA polymerase sigma factor [Bacteroidota bacterium]MDA1268373.1 RNA polymerase sigma factor [Bacteroidota bacterium]